MSLCLASAAFAYDYEANCNSWFRADGPHAIGTTEFEVTDRMRSADYAPVPTDHRRLYVRVWYPANKPANGKPRPYLQAAEVPIVAAVPFTLAGVPADALRRCTSLLTNSYTDAEPVSGSFPVVAFNHGYTSYPAQQTALFEHLASHGYVAITIGHPYESGGLVYPNGDILTVSPRIIRDLSRLGDNSAVMPVHYSQDLQVRMAAAQRYIPKLRQISFGQNTSVWQYDLYFVLDSLEQGTAPASVAGVARMIDYDRRAYMGMSYGGYVAAVAAQGDLRARAAVNLDGGLWTAQLIDAEVRTPFLMLNSDPNLAIGTDNLEGVVADERFTARSVTVGDIAYERLARAGLRSDVYRVMLPGTKHQGFADISDLMKEPSAVAHLGDPEQVSRFTSRQNDMVLGFLDRHVKGKKNDFPKSELAKHPQLLMRDFSQFREQARKLGY